MSNPYTSSRVVSGRFNGNGGRKSAAASGAPVTTWPFTLSIWAYSLVRGSTLHRVMALEQNAVTNIYWAIHRDDVGTAPDNICRYGVIAAAAGSSSATIGTIPDVAGKWIHLAMCVSSATSRRLYVNGQLVATGTVSRSPSGVDCVTVASNTNGANDFQGFLCEPAIWDDDLDNGGADTFMLAALASGGSPLNVGKRAEDLVFYVPNMGSGIDIIGARHLTTVAGTGRMWPSNFVPPQIAARDWPRWRKYWFMLSPPGGPQTIPVGLNLESDSALAVSRLKLKAIGLNTETDSSLALTAVKRMLVGLPEETDVSLAPGRLKARTVGINEETDTPLSPQAGQIVAVGLTEETDSAFATTGAKAATVAVAEETSSALAVAKRKVMAVGLAAETATALAVTRVRTFLAGLASASETAFGVARLKARIAGLATEIDGVLQATVIGGPPATPFAYVLRYPLVSNIVRALTRKARLRTEKPFWPPE